MTEAGYRPNVGVMLVNGAGRVWVGQRADRAEPAWQMPQGGIDAGEDPQTAALRELEEETGIAAGKVEVLGRTEAPLRYDYPEGVERRGHRGQAQVWFLMRYLGGDSEIVLDAHEREFSAWRWIDRGDLVAAIVPFKRAVYAEALAELEKLL